MFGDIAKLMLKKIGHSGTIPGAIQAEDVPAALNSLTSAFEVDKNVSARTGKNVWDDQSVSLQNRALPLIELFRAASEQHCNVRWEEARVTEPGITI